MGDKARTLYVAGKPGNSLAYIGTAVDLRRSLAHMNALRDPDDPISLLWSAPVNSGLDKTIFRALSGRRRHPGHWYDLGNVSAVIAALDKIMSRDRDLRVHENASEEAKRFHVAAVDAAQDALDNAINDLADAPESQPAAPADLDLPRANIIDLVQARAEGQ